MFGKTIVHILIGTFFVCCDSAFVDNLQKCELTDEKCLITLYRSILQGMAKTGIPDLGIPRIDPVDLKNVTVSLLGLLDLTLVEGTLSGFHDCVYNKFATETDKRLIKGHLECNLLAVEGHYKAESSPILQNMLGNAVHGDGHGKVVLEKVQFQFTFPYKVMKDDNGEVYIKPTFDETEHTYQIMGKATFEADNVHLGSQEVSKILTGFLNESWSHILNSFGKSFSDKAVQIYYECSIRTKPK